MRVPVVHVPARFPSCIRHGVGLAVINYNTTPQTIRCLESVRRLLDPPDWVVVLDNGSEDDTIGSAIARFSPYDSTDLRLWRSERNLGFAEGSNRLIVHLLDDPDCRYILLLNNDAVALPPLPTRLYAALRDAPAAGLAGGRMHRLDAPHQVDTLGIALYASLMPADRHALSDHYLGPTGGCVLISRACLEDLRQSAGYWFDPRFFCYCEDTDLVLRARLLGYQPVFVDEILALHEGQASSTAVNGYNSFIAYHGIRNSLWLVVKSIPGRLLAKYGLLFVLAHLMTITRHLLSGHPRLLLRAYRDAFRRVPELLAERRRLRKHARIDARRLDAGITPRFYRRGYTVLVARQLLGLKPGRSDAGGGECT